MTDRVSRAAFLALEAALAVLAALLLLALQAVGLAPNAAFLILPAIAGAVAVRRVVLRVKEGRFRLLRSGGGAARLRWAIPAASWVLLAAWHLAYLSSVTFQLATPELVAAAIMGPGSALLLALGAVWRTGPPRWSALALHGLVLALAGRDLAGLARPTPGEPVVLRSPVTGTWVAGQAGPSRLVNHHWVHASQRHAIDLAGSTFVDDWSQDPVLGAPLLAPAAGTVTVAVDRWEDDPAKKGPFDPAAGNQVVIDVGGGRHVLLAHLRRGSVRVKPGDLVAAGDPIGEVGNSGNSSGPHLHLQVNDGPGELRGDGSGDFRTLPIRLEGATVTRRGRPVTVPMRRGDVLTAP